MKFLILWLFYVVALAVIEVRGNSVAGTYAVGIKVVASRNSPECSKSGPECTEDCSALMLCSLFSTKPLEITSCTTPNQYCVDGACTSNPGPKCKIGGGSGSDFTCTDAGIFPEPSDCTQYHVCDDTGSATRYQCFAGFVFNSQLSMCQIGKTPCTKISCAKATDANRFVAYTSNPAYYAFCMKNDKGTFETLMFKCPYEQFEVFDLKSKQCQFKCKARGNFQNPANCRQYFYCSGANVQPILATCAEHLVFDGTRCNKDADECQHKPTTTTTTAPDPLSESKTADKTVEDLIIALKTGIIAGICAIDSSDPDVCPASGATTETLVPSLYKTETDDADMYFVSVTIKGKHYHVKIFNDKATATPVAILKGVQGPKEDTDDISHFE